MFGVYKKNVKGRPSQITMAATQADGDGIKAILSAENPGVTYIVTPQATVIVDTPETFIARRDAAKTAVSRKASILADALLVAQQRRENGEDVFSDDEIKAMFAKM